MAIYQQSEGWRRTMIEMRDSLTSNGQACPHHQVGTEPWFHISNQGLSRPEQKKKHRCRDDDATKQVMFIATRILIRPLTLRVNYLAKSDNFSPISSKHVFAFVRIHYLHPLIYTYFAQTIQ